MLRSNSGFLALALALSAIWLQLLEISFGFNSWHYFCNFMITIAFFHKEKGIDVFVLNPRPQMRIHIGSAVLI